MCVRVNVRAVVHNRRVYKETSPVRLRVHFLMYTHVYPCIPVYTHVYLCIPIIPMYTHVYWYMPACTCLL